MKQIAILLKVFQLSQIVTPRHRRSILPNDAVFSQHDLHRINLVAKPLEFLRYLLSHFMICHSGAIIRLSALGLF